MFTCGMEIKSLLAVRVCCHKRLLKDKHESKIVSQKAYKIVIKNLLSFDFLLVKLPFSLFAFNNNLCKYFKQYLQAAVAAVLSPWTKMKASMRVVIHVTMAKKKRSHNWSFVVRMNEIFNYHLGKFKKTWNKSSKLILSFFTCSTTR